MELLKILFFAEPYAYWFSFLRLTSGAFSQISLVMIPASLPLQLAEIARNSTAPALTFFVEWGLSVAARFVNASLPQS